MHHVFVSYSRRNSDFVEDVVRRLEQRGQGVWIDRRDIPVSFPWLLDVQDAIAGADVVVEFRSASQAASEACALESATTRKLSKRVVQVPVWIGDRQAAADDVMAAVAAVDADERARTELLVRARAWDRQGRARSALPSRRPQRALARAARAAARPVPEVGWRFLLAARRRNRRRRLLAGAGLLIVILSIAMISGFSDSRETLGQEQDAVESEFALSRALHREAEVNVYGALEQGAQRVAKGRTGFLALDPLWAALDVRVPDFSVRVPGSELVSFKWASPRPAAAVVSADGGVHTVRRSDGASADRGATASPPVGSSARDSGGASTATIGAGGAVEVHQGGSLVLRLWPAHRARAPSLSPDGRLLAVGEAADVGVYDIATGKEQDRLRGSIGTVHTLRWSADGSRVWALAGRHRVSSWLWRRARLVANEPGMELVALSPPNPQGRLVAVSRGGELLITSTRGGRTKRMTTGASEAIAGAFSGDLVAFSGDGKVYVYDLAHRRERAVSPPGCLTAGVAFSPDGSQLHVGCVNTEMRSFNTRTMRLLRRVPVEGGPMRLASLPSGEVLSAGAQGYATLVPPSGTEEIFLKEAHRGAALFAVAASADGNRAAVAGLGAGRPYSAFAGWRGGGGWHWDNLVLRVARGYRAASAVFSGDGELLAIGLQNGKVALFSEGRELGAAPVLTDLPGAVKGLAFLPRGRLATATSSGLIGVYDDVCARCYRPREARRLALMRVAYARRAGLVADDGRLRN